MAVTAPRQAVADRGRTLRDNGIGDGDTRRPRRQWRRCRLTPACEATP